MTRSSASTGCNERSPGSPAPAPRTVAQGLLQAAAAFRAGREAEDDVTLLVVRYRGPA